MKQQKVFLLKIPSHLLVIITLSKIGNNNEQEWKWINQ